jgi:hypothetical protein
MPINSNNPNNPMEPPMSLRQQLGVSATSVYNSPSFPTRMPNPPPPVVPQLSQIALQRRHLNSDSIGGEGPTGASQMISPNQNNLANGGAQNNPMVDQSRNKVVRAGRGLTKNNVNWSM